MNLIRVMPAQGWLERTAAGKELTTVPPSGEKHYDAVVVGGGVIGLSTAWRAALRGLRVCVLEREALGAGASGVAAGMLAPVGEATWGEEKLLGLALASARAWPEFASELEADAHIPSTYEQLGALHVALDRDEVAELRRRHELHSSLGLPSEWLAGSKCRELEPGLATSCAGGLFAPEEAAVDPPTLLAALAVAVRAHGGVIREGAAVDGLEIEGGKVAGVRLGCETVEAPAVVLAAGAWSGAEWLPQEARPPVRPVKGEILELRSAGPAVCERIVAGERFYAVPRRDRRLIVGATVSERGFDSSVTAGAVHELLRESYRALPDVAELELVAAKAGLRPGSPDNTPLIGPGAIDGLILATGHFRNGVLLAPVTAESVVDTLTGKEAAVDVG